ncbi:hypothetical protein CPAV1605_245 [seawater metagenome]|uniref:Uncharacterized protein n=1 Tax=seawater metagenome TaxID=1561972 RepID=A0A5E8CLV3_9ZZZZ
MRIEIITIIIALVRTLRNTMYNEIKGLDFYNTYSLFLFYCSFLILIPLLIKNFSLSMSTSLIYYLISRFFVFGGWYYLIKSSVSNSKDNVIVSEVIIAWTLPVVIRAFLLNITGYEKYNFKNYFYMILILLGNIGVKLYR